MYYDFSILVIDKVHFLSFVWFYIYLADKSKKMIRSFFYGIFLLEFGEYETIVVTFDKTDKERERMRDFLY